MVRPSERGGRRCRLLIDDDVYIVSEGAVCGSIVVRVLSI
jgi:hypothetical protein